MKLGRVPWGPSVHPEALVHIHPHAGFSVVCDRQRTRCPSGLGPKRSDLRSGVCSGVGSPQTLASHGRLCNPRSRVADGPVLGQQDTAVDPQTPIPGTSPELGGWGAVCWGAVLQGLCVRRGCSTPLLTLRPLSQLASETSPDLWAQTPFLKDAGTLSLS